MQRIKERRYFAKAISLGISLALLICLSGCETAKTTNTDHRSIEISIDKGVNPPKGSAKAAALQALVVLAQGNQQEMDAYSIMDVSRISVWDLQQQVLYHGATETKYPPLEIRECSMISRERFQACLQNSLGGPDPGYYSFETTIPAKPSVEASNSLNALENFGRQQGATTIEYCRIELISSAGQNYSHAIAMMLFGFDDGSWKTDYPSMIASE